MLIEAVTARIASRSLLSALLFCICACPDVDCPGGSSPRESEAWFNAHKDTLKRTPVKQAPTLKLKAQQLKAPPKPPGPAPADNGPHPATPEDVRLAFIGKPGGFSAGLAEVDRTDAGPFDARATLAIDSPDGLVDVASEARLDLYRPPEGDGEIFSVGVRWDAQQNGLVAFAKDESGAIGTPVSFPGIWEVDVRMQQTDTDFTISARATPTGLASDPFQVLHTEALPAPATPFEFALGAKGLDPGGTVYFDMFRVEGPQVGGAVERPLMDQLAAGVIVPVQLAMDAINAGSPDLAAMSASLGDALVVVDTVQADTVAAQQAATLQHSTQAKRAHGALKQVAKRLKQAVKLLDGGDAGKLGVVGVQLTAARASAIVATANLAGFKGKTVAQLPIELMLPH